MIEIKGKVCVARVLADSINKKGDRLLTYELEYPRIVHSELVVHGMLPRNSASSRAIPFTRMKEQLTAKPARFGKNKSGMQDDGSVHTGLINNAYTAEEWWDLARLSATKFAEGFHEAGYHKQISGRITECFQMMKTVLSATEYDNFFWLRDHEAADPSLSDLARCMYEAREKSAPLLLQPGEYHLPYVYSERYTKGTTVYYEGDSIRSREITLEEAIKVSCARCAAVSYRAEDYGLERCLRVYDALVGDERKHASAMQHCATPMIQHEYNPQSETDWGVNHPHVPSTWEQGISHADREGNLWSAQYKGWIMYRKLIPGENYTGEK